MASSKEAVIRNSLPPAGPSSILVWHRIIAKNAISKDDRLYRPSTWFDGYCPQASVHACDNHPSLHLPITRMFGINHRLKQHPSATARPISVLRLATKIRKARLINRQAPPIEQQQQPSSTGSQEDTTTVHHPLTHPQPQPQRELVLDS